MEVDFVVERQELAPPVLHLTFDPDESLTTFTDALALASNAGEDAPIWVHGTNAERRAAIEAAGYTSNRTLLKMYCELPVTTTAIETRPFTESDIDAYVEVNNRAFSWHPEQSGMTADAVRQDMAQPWFDADGFRLHFVDQQLAGFCWTKIHEDDGAGVRVGEIYVIAVDPAFHGQGLGKALTLSGLNHISSVGITTGMLYVESDNDAAVATYEKLGFTVGRTDTLWRRNSGALRGAAE